LASTVYLVTSNRIMPLISFRKTVRNEVD